ncbi:MAG: caspase family protein [Candidatus Accumulibacter sp.]|nr:caspase family protein [Candidatus Accumulibacter necessarius]
MLSTEALVDLGEKLRRNDFDVSAHELIAARRVLAALALRDEPPAPRDLAPYLAPVFCNTPEQQQQFFPLFASWIEAWGLDSRHQEPPPPPAPPPPPRRPPVWLPGLLALMLFLGLVTAVWLRPLALAVRVEGEDGRALGARLDLSFADQSVSVSPTVPTATVEYRRYHLPLTLRAQPENADFEAGELTVPAPPLPAEVRLVLKRSTAAQAVEPSKPPEVPPGFSPAGRIAAAAPESPAPTVSKEHRLVPDHLAVAAAFLLLLASGWLWNGLRRRGWLERLPAGGRDTEKRLQSDRGELHGALHAELVQLGRELRRRRLMPSAELDVDRTVAATLRQGGLLTPVFGSRIESEFLVLVDRASLRDHFALMADELLRGLYDRGLSLERFFYDRDPARCRHQPFKHGARDLGSQDLAQLFARFSERRLIVFGDGRDLLDPYSGRPVASVERLLQWGRPVLMTPRPQAEWGRQEWLVERTGFTILPLDAVGLKRLAEVIGRDRAITPPDSRAAERPRPAYLRDLDRLLDAESPGEPLISRVIAALEHDLPPAAFTWLAGCAVYPEIHWGLTLRIGACLIADERQLAERLPALAQLPWLRHGYMPDWLREALLARLPAAAEELIRAELDDFLSRLREAPGDAGALRIVAGPPARRSALADVWRGLKALCSGPPTVEALPAAEDRVFLRFMSAPSNPLGVRASDALRRIFYRQGLPLAGLRPLPLLFVAALGVVLLQSVLPWRETVLVVGPTPVAVVRLPTALALDAEGRGLVIGDSHRGLQAWQETEQGWNKVAAETPTEADAISAVALGAGRMLGVSQAGLLVRAPIGGAIDATLARLRASPVRSAALYGKAPDGQFQLQAGSSSGPAADQLCVAIDAPAAEALSVGAGFLAGIVGGKPVACAVSQGAEQMAVLAADGRVFVLPLRAALTASARAGGKLPAGTWGRGLAVSADGATLAATDDEGRLLLLRAGQAEPTMLDGLQAAGPVALSGDGLTLALADSERQVQLWRVEKPGRNVLLTIAVADLGPGARLQSPLPDVRKVAEVLQRRYGFEVTRLDNPRRAEVLKALDELAASLAPRDRLLIFFSGFGSYAASNSKYGKGERSFSFHLPPGSGGASVATGELSGAEFAARIAAIPARQILTIVDTVEAGRLATLPKATTASSGARGLLYSAGAGQQSMDTGDFSTALANALASAPGALGGRALVADVARRLPAEARKTQTPGYAEWLAAGSDGGEVLLLPIGPKLPETAAKRPAAVPAQAKPEAAPPAVQQAYPPPQQRQQAPQQPQQQQPQQQPPQQQPPQQQQLQQQQQPLELPEESNVGPGAVLSNTQ